MFVSPLQNALLFVISTLFNIYISIVLIRFLLQLVRADFYNPISQLIFKITNPVLIPFRKIIPKYRNVDFGVVLLALILQALELFVLLYIRGFNIPLTVGSISGLFIWGGGELIDLIFVIYLFATVILVIFSWIQPGQYNPMAILAAQITGPISSRIRKMMPNTGLIDFTPMLIIFLLILCRMLISEPLIAFGKSMI